MDFRQLKSFTAVVEYKRFSMGAEKLHSAQPTICTHVRALEEELNVGARVGDRETVKNMAAKGVGVSLIREIAARDSVREQRLLKFELPGYDAEQELYLIHRDKFGAQPAIEQFAAFFQNREVR